MWSRTTASCIQNTYASVTFYPDYVRHVGVEPTPNVWKTPMLPQHLYRNANLLGVEPSRQLLESQPSPALQDSCGGYGNRIRDSSLQMTCDNHLH